MPEQLPGTPDGGGGAVGVTLPAMLRTLALFIALGVIVAACGDNDAAPATTTAAPTTTTVAPTTTTTTTTLPPTPATAEDAGLPWWNDRVFYEIFVRSFNDSDGDGIGDLQGAIERLDYLNDGDPTTDEDLGITGIWLMPVFDSPSYHGYDVTDYRSVEGDYGVDGDLKAFVDAAHDRGIAVIVDLVLNHSSVEHPWFVAAADSDPVYADWYIWADTYPGYAGPFGQTVWHSEGDRFYYALFWEGMPDLNLANPEVTAEVTDIARFWLENAGVDGFRIDAAKHFIEDGEDQESTPATLAWLEAFQQALPDDALVVGEVWSPSQVVGRYIPAALDMAFEFDLAFATIQGIIGGSAKLIADTLDRVVGVYPNGQYAVFLSNHDQERVMSQLGTSPVKARLAATLLLTYPGVPFVYYGEEVGMSGRKPDPRLRTPMPWNDDAPGLGFTTGEPWEDPQSGSTTANVADQTGDPTSLLSLYRDLIHLRNDSPALRYGDTITLETGSRSVLAYLRTIGDDHALVVVNLSIGDVEEYGLTLPGGGPTDPVELAALIGADEIDLPVFDGSGGFVDYRPLEVLPGRAAVVVSLTGTGD